MVPVIQREEQALAVQSLGLQLYRRRRKELEKRGAAMHKDIKDEESAVKTLSKNTGMSEAARRELKKRKRNAERSKHETHGDDIDILTPPSSAPIEAACVQSHQRLQEAIKVSTSQGTAFGATQVNKNRLAAPLVLRSDSEIFGRSQRSDSPILTKEHGVSSEQSCYDYLHEQLQTLPTRRLEGQDSDDDFAVARSDQEADAALQMRKTLMAHYDDLLDHGYVLPSVIDFELLREVVASRNCGLEPSLPPPVQCHVMHCDVPVKTNAQLLAKSPAAEMARLRPKRRCQKLLEAPPIAESGSFIPCQQPEVRRSIDSSSEGIRSPTPQERARAPGHTGAQRKAERWNEEEDWNLLVGMSNNWSSGAIRRRNDLWHRTESAIRSRRQLLKRKHPDLFDEEGRIEGSV
ncbi:hypothetical protein Slin14017_G109170 [Septoria linicola]|nr:hypothetical protein Slin14017_G109170 [Septoria linicola]